MNQSDRSRALAVANYFRAVGLCPLPSSEYEKMPALPAYREHLRGAPVPDDQYTDRAWQTSNIQLLTGITSPTQTKIIVVDCDGKEAVEAWKRICQANGQDKPSRTWKVRTGSGTGHHVYFRVADGTPVRSRIVWGMWDTFGQNGKGSWMKHKEVRILADGALVVAPPSRHVRTQERYEFLERSSPKEFSLPAIAPTWLLGLPAVQKPACEKSCCSDETPEKPRPWRSVSVNGFKIADVMAAIPNKLDLAETWGLRIVNRNPGPEGWVICRAPTREDRNPSCSLHVESGVFRDFAEDENYSFFSLGALLGKFETWLDCMNYCGESFATHGAKRV